MSNFLLDFEAPLKEIEDKINELKSTSIKTGMDVSQLIVDLENKLESEKERIYSSLTRWERVQLARHPKRPHSMDYIDSLTNYWFELYGDRYFGDDSAIIGGFGVIDDVKVLIIAQEKGRTTKEKLYRNFGMPRPEGYRKAYRLMELGQKFNVPILTLIDTPGAYPGKGAEERGQAQAIAKNLLLMSNLDVPIISIVLGEGASGGALGIGLSDKIICLENTWYSVISPEGCASILFRDSSLASKAADSMKVTAKDLYEIEIADEIIKEPNGGAHLNFMDTVELIKISIKKHLVELQSLNKKELKDRRLKKYEQIGSWVENV